MIPVGLDIRHSKKRIAVLEAMVRIKLVTKDLLWGLSSKDESIVVIVDRDCGERSKKSDSRDILGLSKRG